MRMRSMRLKNFRCYQNEISIEFDNLTAFVGKNDIGKSSILEALDIFYNDKKANRAIDKSDVNVTAYGEDDKEIIITVCFDMFPERLVIDATNETTLQDEYLLNPDGLLEVIKKYPNGGSPKVFISANHPTHPICRDLLQKKDSELRKIIDDEHIVCADRTRKAIMRQAIRNHYRDDLQFDTIEISVQKDDPKSIWDNLQNYLPIYTLFQADRKNCEGDSEVQDPLKEAVKEILKNDELQTTLDGVANTVLEKLSEVADRTLDKLREMDPDIANTLNPYIPPTENLKWQDVFKGVAITSDDDIRLDKRGSGVKRLILLSFFRGEAERRQQEQNSPSIIYAIEEPETSQHAENQKKLIGAFKTLSEAENTQILITTHSSTVVKQLDFSNIRLIIERDGRIVVENDFQSELPYPSLNEINYLAFADILEEYHNELYGYLKEEHLFDAYKRECELMEYLPDDTHTWQCTLSEYVRHQIHHPENRRNRLFTETELETSIVMMRDFIRDHPLTE